MNYAPFCPAFLHIVLQLFLNFPHSLLKNQIRKKKNKNPLFPQKIFLGFVES